MRKYLTSGILPVLVLIIASLNGCYYDNAEELNPNLNKQCDTISSFSYNSRLKPILTTSCGTTGSQALDCHGSGATSGWALDNYAGLVDAANNNLIDAIQHTNGISPMPKNGGKLDNCSIEAFKKWIDLGKPQN